MSESVSDSASDPSSNGASGVTSATPTVPKPGELFRRKRLENEWTKEGVAKTLLLSVQHIEALENDEYDKLAGTTYVVGYWRSYANLLKIDISESIEFHKSYLKVSPSAITLEGEHHRTHNHQEKARKRSGLVFFVLSAIFLTGIWYWQNPDDNLLGQWFDNRANHLVDQLPKTDFSKGGNQIISGEVTPAILEPSPYNFGALPEPNFPDDITNSATEIAVEEGDRTPTERVNNGDSQDASSWQQEQKVEETELAPTQSVEKASENVSEPAAETPVADSPNWIFFRVEKKSWLDVQDVIGERLMYRIAKAGESISLKGVPPFYVFVGAADGVQVEYLGKPIRFKPSGNSRVARFVVGRVGKDINQ